MRLSFQSWSPTGAETSRNDIRAYNYTIALYC